MAGETDAEQIEYFALEIIRPWPDGCNRLDGRAELFNLTFKRTRSLLGIESR